MANYYWGDGAPTTTVDGNWDNKNNWYIVPASQTGCGCVVAGTKAPQPPGQNDTVYLIGPSDITNGPSLAGSGYTTFTGTIQWISAAAGSTVTPANLNAANLTCTGLVTINPITNSSNNACGILKGTFSNVLMKSAATATSSTTIPRVGGTAQFTGTFTRQSNVTGGIYINIINGGTYAPSGVLTLTGGVLTGTLPTDPGFALGNGTFSLANITVSGGGPSNPIVAHMSF